VIQKEDSRLGNQSKVREQIPISLNQNQAQNEPSFVTLRQISEDQKIGIIKTGFQLNQKGKISLKNYYEGTGEYTLFEWKGFKSILLNSIKYESIRRTKLYTNFKGN
jgi:hypothetical protein